MSPERTTNEPGIEPQWYKDAVIYELHVKTFHDSNGDGIGDFRGLIQKLDYLQDLGVTAIWLLPFYPSPLKDDGYDIADYTDVHPSYGTLKDFRAFLREAHKRGLRVITELVLNHTSDKHEWFRRARLAKPGDRYRDFYVWTDDTEKYKEARIIFKDFETSNWTWDATANAYYWHRFYHHQPDLNFDSPHVRRALFRVLDFWMQMGVDGVRLDAVPYLLERDGTSCENLPETHAFLKELRAHVEARYPDRMLLAEANQWPEDAVPYFGDGDECHMAFHFPLMPRLFMAVRMEDRYPIVEILRETPQIPDTSQWALFLRNHDELTLEMVTDEDRDYMYRAYAQDAEARINLGIRRRLAPLLGNHRRKIELMSALLMSLPGTPVLYYGDEIGMGDNIYLGDRDGVRTPMQWNSDRNAGFSAANPQRLYLPPITDPEYHFETVNVEGQYQNPHSLLWWTKRLIALRKRHPAFGRGSIEFLYPENAKVLAFVRRYGDESILVVANLSRFVQSASMDLAEFEGSVPVEAFGGTRFPAITREPLTLTFGPHSFYWFILEQQAEPATAIASASLPPPLTVTRTWENALQGRAKSALEALMPTYLRSRRWFGAKARTIRGISIVDSFALRQQETLLAYLTLVEVSYREGENETYLLPIGFAEGEAAEQLLANDAGALIARLNIRGGSDGVLFDASVNQEVCSALLSVISGRRTIKGRAGTVRGETTSAFRGQRRGATKTLSPSILRSEQSNTSVIFGDRFILKLLRRPDEGVNPDLEIGQFLTNVAKSSRTPAVTGYIEYRSTRGQIRTLAILHALVANQGDTWQYTLDELGRYYERVMTHAAEIGVATLEPHFPTRLPIEDASDAIGIGEAASAQQQPEVEDDLIGVYAGSARLLGERTAQMHLALGSNIDDPAFAPEPFTPFYQRSLRQSLRNSSRAAFDLLRASRSKLTDPAGELADRVLKLESRINERLQTVFERNIDARRIRCHGDFHLGQVLFTGSDFIIIDFEGEPARPVSERRVKRSPLRDVAGMLRSFHYAAFAALRKFDDLAAQEQMESWTVLWQQRSSAAFLSGYIDTASDAGFLPKDEETRRAMIDAYLLEKALYELTYELNNRPDWVSIPLMGILQLVEAPDDD